MLNMIPMEIIKRNENLRNAFTSGDILQAVKWGWEGKKAYWLIQ